MCNKNQATPRHSKSGDTASYYMTIIMLLLGIANLPLPSLSVPALLVTIGDTAVAQSVIASTTGYHW